MPRTDDEIPQSEHNEHRMRRAFSWLEQSEKTESDAEKFIFLCIAFNAAYGGEAAGMAEEDPAGNRKLVNFLREIIERDEQKKIETILLEKHSGPARVLLDSRYTFKPFWQWVRGEPEGADWRERFETHRAKTRIALDERNVHGIFLEVFCRLYVLRDQILHGGVAFTEIEDRTRLRDGARIMADVVPVVLEIMKAEIDANPETQVWGKVAGARINENGHEKM